MEFAEFALSINPRREDYRPGSMVSKPIESHRGTEAGWKVAVFCNSQLLQGES